MKDNFEMKKVIEQRQYDRTEKIGTQPKIIKILGREKEKKKLLIINIYVSHYHSGKNVL